MKNLKTLFAATLLGMAALAVGTSFAVVPQTSDSTVLSAAIAEFQDIQLTNGSGSTTTITPTAAGDGTGTIAATIAGTYTTNNPQTLQLTSLNPTANLNEVALSNGSNTLTLVFPQFSAVSGKLTVPGFTASANNFSYPSNTTPYGLSNYGTYTNTVTLSIVAP